MRPVDYPSIRRGTNTVLVTPPAPAWATEAMTLLLTRIATESGRLLLLTSEALLGEWGTTLHHLAPSGLRLEIARGTARAARRLKQGDLDVLVTTPDIALALHTRSALAADSFTALAFAWPEDWQADEALAVLMQDLPKDAQRVLLCSSVLERAVVDRFARKAIQVVLGEAGPAAGPVRTVPTPWAARAATVAELVELLDPAMLTVWTISDRDHPVLAAALGGPAAGIALGGETLPSSGSIICYDLPDPATLARLVAVGDVLLLTPPGTEAYLQRIATPRRPLPTTGAVATLLRRDAATRQRIASAVQQRDLDAALYLLAPLFEQHEPQRVAAALHLLWQEAQTPAAAPVTTAPPVMPETATPVGGIRTARVWVGAGKKDQATVADLVAILVREVGLERSVIGRIDLRETFSLVEVPADQAAAIAQRLTGITLRRRKLSARVDGGPSDGPPRTPRTGGTDRPRRAPPRGRE